MNFAEKSICARGNLKNGPISYNCYPVNEFSQNKWLLSVNSVSFDSAENISQTCAIVCNFVTAKGRLQNGDIKIFQQPLNIFHLKTSQAAQRGIFRFCNY